MLRTIIAALALAGCASAPHSKSANDSFKQERTEEHGQALRDEFNAATGDAY